MARLKEKEQFHKEQQHEIQLKLKLTNDTEEKLQKKIDQIEMDMWDNRTFQQAKEKMQQKPKTFRTKTFVSFGVFAVALSLMIVFQSIWSVALVFVSALIVGYAIMTTWKALPTNNEQLLVFLEQKKIRQEWQQLLNEMDIIASQIAELRATENKLNETIYQHTMELKQLFSDLGIKHNPDANWAYELAVYKKIVKKLNLQWNLSQN